ncbi:MAG: hypothetical protein IJV41_09005 [Oscillospiraceae bacterium]|nr:hypothetical protein [Oscillospiraceae bacterium]
MKVAEKEFHIYANERPKVLLLGNGLYRAFGGMSWNGLLDEIKDQEEFPLPAERYYMPMPLKAAMLTNNTLASKMREIVKEGGATSNYHNTRKTNWNDFTKTSYEMREYINQLVRNDFDYVLTTNYSYEIEAALLNENSLSPNQIAKLMNFHEVDHPQLQFLINTFNYVEKCSVWHIHGEARKPDSMIIGSYYYGKILKRCIERLDGGGQSTDGDYSGQVRSSGKTSEFKRNIKQKKPQKIGSWVDAFVLGDVYILGLGMDFSEADLWWLLEYKQNNSDFCGKTELLEAQKRSRQACLIDEKEDCEYYGKYVDGRQCRNLLMKTYHVDITDLGVTINSSEDYKYFYTRVADYFTNPYVVNRVK